MSLVETDALVLKSYNLAEADRIVLFFTKDAGMVRGVAKGAKRPKSKFGSCLEPFSVVRLTFSEKDTLELVSVGNAELITSYFANASQPEFLHKFSYLTDLLAGFAPPHDPNPDLYRMVKSCLETAAADIESLQAIGLYFEWWLLRLGGYLPDWSKCDECKREFGPQDAAGLKANFHLQCSRCRRGHAMREVSPEQRRLFAEARRRSPAAFAELCKELDDAALNSNSAVLKQILSHVIGREVNGDRSLAISL